MKRLLILTTLAALTSVSLGCCGMGRDYMGGCFGRRNECSPCEEPTGDCGCGCNSCGGGAGPMMSAPAVITTPGTTVTPGPAYSTGYLPKN